MLTDKYHVFAGLAGIYAGITDLAKEEWVDKTEVTEEALQAAAKYIIGESRSRKLDTSEYHGFKWKLKNGGEMYLSAKIIKEKEAKEK